MGAKSSTKSIGEDLLAALTQTEIARLLTSLLQGLPSQQLEKSLADLSPDTQQTVRKILAPPKSGASKQSPQDPPVSLAKLAQTWSEQWQAWDAIVWEASEEEGKYIEQEHHWEQPYFDNYAFAEDLDKVAEKMRSLLPVAFENGFIPNTGFAPALLEAESQIVCGIPDWMELIEGISLETHVTYCLFQWEWLTAQAQGRDAFQFAQRIRQLESDFSQMGWDDNTLINFLRELSQDDQRCILTGLTNEKETLQWKTVLGNTYSPWHWFYMEAINQFAPERYLDNLRMTISQTWSNGLPVIEDLLAHNNYSESLTVIQETLTALLKSNQRGKPWTPETSLLVNLVSGAYYYREGFENEKTLLRYWQKTAEALGQTEQVNALKIQQIAFKHLFDWRTMFQTFADISVSEQTHQALFQSWRNHVVQRATPQTAGFGSRQGAEPGWPHWLIESIVDAQKGAPWFQQQITQWIAGLSGNHRNLGNDYNLLRLLTKDLQAIEGHKRLSYPTFYQVVIRMDELSALDDASRQAYLQQFAPDDLWRQVMDYWKTHLHHFIPDPKSAQKI